MRLTSVSTTTTSPSRKATAAVAAAAKKSFTQVAARVAPIRVRVREMFDRTLKPADVHDTDPGNAVPFFIRHQIRFYRMVFLLYMFIFLLVLITLPRTFLHDATSGALLWRHMVFGLIMCCLVIAQHWSVCGSDPGYIPNDLAMSFGEEHLQHHVEGDLEDHQPMLTSSRSFEYLHSSPAPKSTISRPTSSDEFLHVDDDDEAGEYELNEEETSKLIRLRSRADSNSSTAVTVEETADDDDDEAEDPVDLVIPIRAKYCKTSKQIVATYDHHCQMLNTTIGERNRARFWLLLLWCTMGLIWSLAVAHSGFRNVLFHPTLTWFSYNSHALVVAVFVWTNFACIVSLFLFHTFLMLANVTSHEFMKSEKLKYLRGTRDFDLPFSMGMRANLVFFFTSDSAVQLTVNRLLGKQTEWKPHLWPKPNINDITEARNSTDVWQHPWHNRYWSCC